MEQYEDWNNQRYSELAQSTKVHSTFESGLIPVTSNILRESEVIKE